MHNQLTINYSYENFISNTQTSWETVWFEKSKKINDKETTNV